MAMMMTSELADDVAEPTIVFVAAWLPESGVLVRLRGRESADGPLPMPPSTTPFSGTEVEFEPRESSDGGRDEVASPREDEPSSFDDPLDESALLCALPLPFAVAPPGVDDGAGEGAGVDAGVDADADSAAPPYRLAKRASGWHDDHVSRLDWTQALTSRGRTHH